jgi:uncharacterized protein with von Willebrand factor type A (vWA) domain
VTTAYQHDEDSEPVAIGSGKLAQNILHFARALREAGLPVGPGSVVDAIRAAEAAGIGTREDFRATLHAVFVKKHEHSVIFDQAFAIFWRRRGYMEKLIGLMSPVADPKTQAPKPKAGATRVSDALMKQRPHPKPEQALEVDRRFTTSMIERLQTKDFAQMSAAEIAAAGQAIAKLRLADETIATRRFRPHPHRDRIDMRRMMRNSLRAGGASISLAFRERAERHRPIVAICDISGSMSDYTRIFLHFLHALTEQRRRVSTFLFGTRLTNITRALQSKDIDEALVKCSAGVKDWSGGTRIAASLHAFNRDWSRRVLGQGAIVLLFTDGLEREGLEDLPRELERLRKSSRRLIWVNPLLRYADFEAKASGIRAILPFVDEFRPIHNLRSMAELVAALGREGALGRADPKLWLKRAA